VTEVLARRDRALTPEETEKLLRERLGEGITGSTVEFATFTVHVAPGSWHAAVALCRDDQLLAYDMFDNLLGVDAREEGFDVVAVLYSTSTGNRICLRTRCDGGRDTPVCDTITDVFRGADWMERETWDMFGIDFVGHPALEPRILTVENFEGWPLRKDFHLASRVAKPWPGVAEPAELDEDGKVIERVPQIGDAPGPFDLDKAMAAQAKAINAPEDAELEQGAEPSETATSAGEADEPAPELDQETFDRLIAEGKSERIARSKAKAAFIKKQRAGEAPGGDAGSVKADAGSAKAGGEPQLDQETFDRLIAEGKSERIARSKAKAALIKKKRAAEAAGSDAGAATADDADTADVSAPPGDTNGGDDDPAAAAAARADDRRKAQAKARANKAAERAAEDDGAASGGADADADAGNQADQEGDA